MKTYKQFNQDINENAKAWLGKAWKFTRPLKTLDRIDNVNVIRNKGKTWKFAGEAMVNKNLVAESDFTAMMVQQ